MVSLFGALHMLSQPAPVIHNPIAAATTLRGQTPLFTRASMMALGQWVLIFVEFDRFL